VTTIRDARRSVERGDLDAAMVALWNLLEPLRLRGDLDGLHRVSELAREIGEQDGGTHRVEAQRLRAAVEELTGAGVATVVVEQAQSLDDEAWTEVVPIEEEGDAGSPAEDEESAGRRLGPLVWALLVGLFLLLNVLGNVFGDG